MSSRKSKTMNEEKADPIKYCFFMLSLKVVMEDASSLEFFKEVQVQWAIEVLLNTSGGGVMVFDVECLKERREGRVPPF